jgi:hypothetical protein
VTVYQALHHFWWLNYLNECWSGSMQNGSHIVIFLTSPPN